MFDPRTLDYQSIITAIPLKREYRYNDPFDLGSITYDKHQSYFYGDLRSHIAHRFGHDGLARFQEIIDILMDLGYNSWGKIHYESYSGYLEAEKAWCSLKQRIT